MRSLTTLCRRLRNRIRAAWVRACIDWAEEEVEALAEASRRAPDELAHMRRYIEYRRRELLALEA